MNPFFTTANTEAGHILRLRPGFRIISLSLKKSVILGNGMYFFLNGTMQVKIIGLIDGSRSETEITRQFNSSSHKLAALHLIDRLTSDGIIESLPPKGYRESGIKTGSSTQKRISLLYIGDLEKHLQFEKILKERGWQLCGYPSPEMPDLQIVISSDPGHPDLGKIQKTNQKNQVPWLYFNPSSNSPYISPLIHDHNIGPCWYCVSYRLLQNRPVEEYIRRISRYNDFGSPELNRPAGRIMAEWISSFIHCFFSELKPPSHHMMIFDDRSLQLSLYPIPKRPQCPYCGDATLMSSKAYLPIKLSPIEKNHTHDGGFRHHSPAFSFEIHRHLVHPTAGIVSQLGPMPGIHTESRPVFVSGYRVCPNSKDAGKNSFQTVCAGKGKTLEQARASALFEAVERFSSVYQGDEACVRGSLNDLEAAAIHPNMLQLFSDAQLSTPGYTYSCSGRSYSIPQPCIEHKKTDWTPAWSLTRKSKRFIPFSYCYTNLPPHINEDYALYNGNGTASGTCIEEAVLQGFLELVERDAVSIWWYNMLAMPGVEADSIEDLYFKRMKNEFTELGWQLWVLDLTHDLKIPVYAALAKSESIDRFSIGFGCHLDGTLALHRALTELNQIFDPNGHQQALWDHDDLASVDFLFPNGTAIRNPGDYRSGQPDLRSDLNDSIQVLDQSGLEMIAVDKTRPDTGIHVVQVIVPGLRHFRPCFGKGRLYTVPVKLDMLSRPLTENELNKVPLLI